jgi:hypothetical protein
MHEFTSSTILLHSLPSPHTHTLIPGVVSTGIIFAFTYMYIHYITPYSPSYPFSSTPPLSHYCQLSLLSRAYSALLFSDFAGEKREKIKQKS